MNKEFLPYDRVRDGAIKMAKRIIDDGFMPDIIYVSLRGGAYMGNVISEYFKCLRKNNKAVLYAGVVARSYSGIAQNASVMIDGWTYDPAYLRAGDKVLLIDDIFDTGQTLKALLNVILSRGIPRSDIKVAVHDFKFFEFRDNTETTHHPDYFCRKFIIKTPEEDKWIHYMSHELVGLELSEIGKNYPQNDPELTSALHFFLEKSQKK